MRVLRKIMALTLALTLVLSMGAMTAMAEGRDVGSGLSVVPGISAIKLKSIEPGEDGHSKLVVEPHEEGNKITTRTVKQKDYDQGIIKFPKPGDYTIGDNDFPEKTRVKVGDWVYIYEKDHSSGKICAFGAYQVKDGETDTKLLSDATVDELYYYPYGLDGKPMPNMPSNPEPPDFDPKTSDYTVKLPYEFSKVTIGGYNHGDPYQTFLPVHAKPDSPVAELLVTADDGTEKNYTITFTTDGETPPANTDQAKVNAEAKKITEIAAPAKDATTLTLPKVADGFTVAIKSSDKPSVIATNGKITPPAKAETVALVLTVSYTGKGVTADTATINVTVPANSTTPGSPDQEKVNAEAAKITSITAPAKDATRLTLPTVGTGFTVAIKSSNKTNVIATNGKITPPAKAEAVALVLAVSYTGKDVTADTATINVIVPAKSSGSSGGDDNGNDNGGGSSGGGGTPPSSNNANSPETTDKVKDTIAAIKDPTKELPAGAVKTTTAGGASITTIPVALSSGSATLGTDIFNTIGGATSSVGLKITVSNGMNGGSMEVIIPGGFGKITEPGRISYPMDYNATAEHSSTMTNAVKGDDAVSMTAKVGGNFTLPVTATVAVPTKLANGSKVNIYKYDPLTNKLIVIGKAVVKDGKIAFATKMMGEMLFTTGTV